MLLLTAATLFPVHQSQWPLITKLQLAVLQASALPAGTIVPQPHTTLCRIAMVPISKVTLSVAVQHNRELEKQQAAIQQVIELPVYDWMRICLTV